MRLNNERHKLQALLLALQVCVFVASFQIFVLLEDESYLCIPITQQGVAQARRDGEVKCPRLMAGASGQPDICWAASLCGGWEAIAVWAAWQETRLFSLPGNTSAVHLAENLVSDRVVPERPVPTAWAH